MELVTSVHTLADLKSLDPSTLQLLDAIYLGDSFACEYEENLNLALDDLKKAVDLVKNMGKKAYVSTFAVPRNEDLPNAEKLLGFIAENRLPVDGIEIHNYGLISMIRETAISMPIFCGSASNIYTAATAELLKSSGVRRITAGYELTLKELSILSETGTEVEILAQGPMALGISEKCPALYWSGGHQSEKELSAKTITLKSGSMELKLRGRATFSGRDVCLLEHMNNILDKGFGIFRIDWSLQNSRYLKAAAESYRRAIDSHAAGSPLLPEELGTMMEELQSYSPGGFCNGFLFGLSGADYVKPEKC